jgi:hypothetical protein
MANQEHRYLDPDLMNLNGGLFDNALLRAPIEWEVGSEQTPPALPAMGDPPRTAAQAPAPVLILTPASTPVLALAPASTPVLALAPAPTPARVRSRRPRVLEWTAGAVAALMGIGLAAASHLPASPPRAPQVASAAQPEPAAVAVDGALAAPLAAAPPQVPSADPLPEPPAAEQPPGGTPVQEPSRAAPGAAKPPASPMAPTASMVAPLQEGSQGATPGSLAALAAPRQFNHAAAAVAIASAARGAGGCTASDDARATMPVRVVYAPSGRVTSAALQGGPFLGTAVGSCIARALQSAKIDSFEGAPTGVNTTIRIH